MIWKSKFNQLAVQFIDFITVIVGFYIAYVSWNVLNKLYPSIFPVVTSFENVHVFLILVIATTFVFFLTIFGAYQFQRFTSLLYEYLLIFKITIISFLLLILLIYLLKLGNTPRTIIIVSFIEIFILFIIQKTIMFWVAKYNRGHKHDRKGIIIFGTGERAKLLIEKINQNFSWGLDIIGIVSSDLSRIGEVYYDKKVLGTYKNLTNIFKKFNPQEVIITVSAKKFDEIHEVFNICEREGVQVRLISDFFSKISNNIRIDHIYGLDIISFSRKPISDFYIILKRILDIFISFLLIILFSPFILVAVIGIIISDGYPILYKWKIVGYNMKSITSWKFRTMFKNADEIKKKLINQNEMQGPVFKIKDDPRIFKFGKFLRKFSIDELPQLFSVLKGDLSLVGPRPPLEYEFSEFESWHRRKLSVKPGITCLWQIKGRNEISDFDEWVKLDLEYIDNRSLKLDFKILFLTFLELIKGSGR